MLLSVLSLVALLTVTQGVVVPKAGAVHLSTNDQVQIISAKNGDGLGWGVGFQKASWEWPWQGTPIDRPFVALIKADDKPEGATVILLCVLHAKTKITGNPRYSISGAPPYLKKEAFNNPGETGGVKCLPYNDFAVIKT